MRRANRPLTNEGIATLTLASVESKIVEDVRKMKKGLAPDSARYEALDLVFLCKGLTGDFQIKERCGAVINDEPVSTKYRGKEKQYNKLTTLLLSTGLVTEETLPTCDPDEIQEKLLALEGTEYTAKLVKDEGFYRVDLSTLKLTV